jgi:hypothetical protein
LPLKSKTDRLIIKVTSELGYSPEIVDCATNPIVRGITHYSTVKSVLGKGLRVFDL